MIPSNALYSLVVTGLTIHFIAFLTDIGIEPIKAAGLLAIRAAVSIPARFFGGLISDRLKKGHLQFLLAGAYGLQGVGFLFFLLHPTTTMIYVWMILYGIGHGVALVLTVLIRGRYFGRKSFGSIRGVSMLVITPLGIVAPIYAGWAYDTTGSYISTFTLFTALLIFSSVIMLVASPPKPPDQVTDVDKIL
ncbi:MFS transporter [Chloroflexota bacterium]